MPGTKRPHVENAPLDALVEHLIDALRIADEFALPPLIGVRIQHAIDTCYSETRRGADEPKNEVGKRSS